VKPSDTAYLPVAFIYGVSNAAVRKPGDDLVRFACCQLFGPRFACNLFIRAFTASVRTWALNLAAHMPSYLLDIGFELGICDDF
jgi:hypothetical protein